jgi:hypothetical protein
MFLLHTLPQQIWAVCMLAVCAFTFWRGGAPERIASSLLIVGSVAAGIVQNRHDFSQTQWGDLVVDVAFLAILLWLALRTDRHWPMFAAAFQLISVITYVARMVDSRVGALAPYQAVVIWSYMILGAISVGTILHWRDKRFQASRE